MAKYHDILLSFRERKFAVSGDISKAFPRVKTEEVDQDFTRFLWFNREQMHTLTYRFKVGLFRATSSPYLLQEILHAHFTENAMGNSCVDKFYVDD